MVEIFTLYCREGSNGEGRNPKPRKLFATFFIGCTTFFIQPVPENMLEYKTIYSRYPVAKFKWQYILQQSILYSCISCGCYFHLCPLFSFCCALTHIQFQQKFFSVVKTQYRFHESLLKVRFIAYMFHLLKCLLGPLSSIATWSMLQQMSELADTLLASEYMMQA